MDEIKIFGNSLKKGFFAVLLLLYQGHLSCLEMTPQEALQKLIEGNQRFIEDQSIHPNRTAERRLETVQMQNPFAVVLGCSDSRVPLEIILDQGIGDLFIIRVAGNVVGPIELDSIEFAVYYLGTAVVMVLGHENCGAVNAVLEGKTKDIAAIAKLIEPAVKKSHDHLEEAVKANVINSVNQLKNNKGLAKLIQEKKLDIVGGYYDFHTGKVELLNHD